MRVSWSGFAAGCTLAGAATAGAQQPLAIAYQFRADSPATHLGEVTLRVSGATSESTLIQLPGWYPGRYAIYNFAANVQDARATCDGAAAPAPKLDKQTWLVRCPARGRPAAITFAFRVWWDDLTGSHSQIDSLHVNLNPGNIFPYVVGHKSDPVTVTYAGPPGWLVVNGASPAPAPGPVTQAFPNYDLLIDHPTEISSRFTVDTFRVGRVPYRVVLHAEEGDATARAPLVEGIRRIVALDPYAGLLVSMHGSGIYQGRYGAGPIRMTTQTDEVRALMDAFVAEHARNLGVGQPRARTHDGGIKPVFPNLAVALDRHVAGHAKPVDLRIERAKPVRKPLGQHRNDAPRKIDRIAALARIQIERVAVPNVMADVGDGNDEPVSEHTAHRVPRRARHRAGRIASRFSRTRPRRQLLAIHRVVEILG